MLWNPMLLDPQWRHDGGLPSNSSRERTPGAPPDLLNGLLTGYHRGHVQNTTARLTVAARG